MIVVFALLATLVSIPSGNTKLSPTDDIIEFVPGSSNDLFIEEFDIPTPKPRTLKLKGKTAFGKDCFCSTESSSLYLPPIKNEDCICKKKCCKTIPVYLPPPDDCEICPKCYCNTTTYTLVNKESGNCPSCKPPPPKICECRYGVLINKEKGNCPPCTPPCRCVNGRYVNEGSGNCPDICVPLPPPRCTCVSRRLFNERSGNCPVCVPLCYCSNGRFVNEYSGNCPLICVPPPCRCVDGRYINENSGNCPAKCKPNCSCDKTTGQLINTDTGICPTSCAYRYNKPVGFEKLSTDFL